MVIYQIVYDIMMMVFAWAFVLLSYFIFRYMRRIRQERARFITMEPQFQQFDEQYNLNEEKESLGMLGSLLNRSDSSFQALRMNLEKDLSELKTCSICGSLCRIEDLMCVICGNRKFLKYS